MFANFWFISPFSFTARCIAPARTCGPKNMPYDCHGLRPRRRWELPRTFTKCADRPPVLYTRQPGVSVAMAKDGGPETYPHPYIPKGSLSLSLAPQTANGGPFLVEVSPLCYGLNLHDRTFKSPQVSSPSRPSSRSKRGPQSPVRRLLPLSASSQSVLHGEARMVHSWFIFDSPLIHLWFTQG